MKNTSIQLYDTRKSVNGSVYFQLQKLSYLAGETIEGSVFVDLKEDYEGSVLMLSLEGVEEINNSTLKKEVNSEVKRFLNSSKMIYNFSQNDGQSKMKPGQWKISFEMEIPAEIPSQVNLFYNFDSCYRINYYLCAYIIPIDQFLQSPLQGIQRIIIANDSQINNNNPTLATLKDTPKFLLFLGMGEYTLKCHLPKSNFHPGEKSIITLEFDFSNFKQEVSELKIELKGILSQTKHSHKQEFSIFTTSTEISSKKGLIKDEIMIPISCPFSTVSESGKLEFNLQVTPKTTLDLKCKLNTLSQQITIKANKQYFKYFNIPQIKKPKQNSSSSKNTNQTVLIDTQSNSVCQQNNSQFSKFCDSQLEYKYYYTIEKNLSPS